MSFGNLIHRSNFTEKYRLIEKYEKKIINLNWSIQFNKICMQENIMPKYTTIHFI